MSDVPETAELVEDALCRATPGVPCAGPGCTNHACRAAWIAWEPDGSRWVYWTADEILVREEYLQRGRNDAGTWEPDDCGGVLTLDSAAEYRYRLVRRDDVHEDRFIFERIRAAA